MSAHAFKADQLRASVLAARGASSHILQTAHFAYSMSQPLVPYHGALQGRAHAIYLSDKTVQLEQHCRAFDARSSPVQSNA